jgi:hypothetical protein
MQPSVFDIFDRLGPTPRLCLLARLPHALKCHESDLNNVISNIDLHMLKKIFSAVALLEMDEISHKLCLIRRSDEGDIYSDIVVHTVTDWIKSRLALRLRNLEQAEQIHPYRLFSRARGNRSMAGILYQAMVQSDLQHGISLIAFPMVEKPVDRSSSSEIRVSHLRWYSSRTLPDSCALETLDQVPLNQLLVIQPDSCQQYSDSGLSSMMPNVIYIPQLTNQKVVDSFILVDGTLCLLQFPTTSTHEINHGLAEVGDKYGLPPMELWRFVFLIPPNMTLTVPQPRKMPPRDLALYSAVVGPEAQSLQ